MELLSNAQHLLRNARPLIVIDRFERASDLIVQRVLLDAQGSDASSRLVRERCATTLNTQDGGYLVSLDLVRRTVPLTVPHLPESISPTVSGLLALTSDLFSLRLPDADSALVLSDLGEA